MDKIGKKLAFSSAFIYNKHSGELLCRGTHLKAFLPMDYKGLENVTEDDLKSMNP